MPGCSLALLLLILLSHYVQCISFFTLLAKLISLATFQPRLAIVPVSASLLLQFMGYMI